MTKLPTIYDLVLLLSTESEEEERTRILTEVESTIPQGGGNVELKQSWGTRPLTFPIEHQTEAHYELLQFSGPSAVLESLSHNLGITDGVLRHRIIKVAPGTPPAPDAPPPLVGASAGSGESPEPGPEDGPPSPRRAELGPQEQPARVHV